MTNHGDNYYAKTATGPRRKRRLLTNVISAENIEKKTTSTACGGTGTTNGHTAKNVAIHPVPHHTVRLAQCAESLSALSEPSVLHLSHHCIPNSCHNPRSRHSLFMHKMSTIHMSNSNKQATNDQQSPEAQKSKQRHVGLHMRHLLDSAGKKTQLWENADQPTRHQ